MDDERVDMLLKALPRETASPDFTARVLARLDDEAAAGTSPRIFGLPRLTLPAAVLAATLAVAASVSLQGGGMTALPSPAKSQVAARIASPLPSPTPPLQHFHPLVRPERFGAVAAIPASSRTRSELASVLSEIRADHTRLNAEVRRLREARGSTLYLGGDEDLDVVVHLDRVREQPDRQPDPPPYFD